MKVVVLGATGGTGRAAVHRALNNGHQVVAVVRRPAALATDHPRLRVVGGDVLDPAALLEPVAGADAVVSALGIGYSRAATTVYSAGTANVIAAMRAGGVRRLAVVSTTSMAPPPWSAPVQSLLVRGLLHPMLRRPYADMRLMEQHVRDSGLDWTLIRAARLTDGRAAERRPRTAVDGRLPGAWSVSRGDLAAYLLDSIDNPAVVGRTVEIAY
ncbi:NAD(P)-dependent oxidoreductase [Kitasatospora viridis]|uniref:Putative NADH-flavin reductase n=1 Tax=Kitasatospora viridis TaxID=281105 RepID=A0A561UCH9_9ACTN|nr:NAD(P)H-binding protein [Kitasatospora viridis]TWF97068.1 putative NADH-flavin reductase [Kitasatospora viridis]